jgi:hypothetical protein
MPRRFLFVVAIVAIILAACGGGGATQAPALTDPKDILTKSVGSLQDFKTVHLKASLSGKLDSGALSGGTGSGTMVDLSGSTIEGDLDRPDSEAKISVSVPAILGFSADLVATGGKAWVKSSLSPDGKYHAIDLASMTGGLPLPSLPAVASPDPSAMASVLDAVRAELDKLPAPTKLADEKIGDQDTYHVQWKLTSADLPQASAALPQGSFTLDLWSRKSDYRPARLTIVVDGGTSGTLTFTVDLTNYDAPVTVTAPSADQVSDKPFSFPGLTP